MDNEFDLKLEKIFESIQEIAKVAVDITPSIARVLREKPISQEFLNFLRQASNATRDALQADLPSPSNCLSKSESPATISIPLVELARLKSESVEFIKKTQKASKVLQKILTNFGELEEMLKSGKNVEICMEKIELDKRYIQKRCSFLKFECATPQYLPNLDHSPQYDSSTIITSSENEYFKYLEVQICMLQNKATSLIKAGGITTEVLASIDEEIRKNYEFDEAKPLETQFFKSFQRETSEIYHKFLRKIDFLSESLIKLKSTSNKAKVHLLEKISQLQSEKSQSDSLISEYKTTISNYELQIALLKAPALPHEVIVDLSSCDIVNQEIEIMQKNYEDILFMNMQLKAELLNNEGELTKLRKMENDLQKIQDKCDFFEKVNKELTKKNDDSEDSLDLDCNNIKDAIEIQELRAALRSVSERYEQEKETILRDCEESRQDIETQMFRLHNEKAYIEVKFKDTEKFLADVVKEREKQEGNIASLRNEIERLKDAKLVENVNKISYSRRGSDDNLVSASGDFDLTESLDKFAAVNSDDLLEILQEEINEIVSEVLKNNLLPINFIENIEILKEIVGTLARVKKLLDSEIGLAGSAGSKTIDGRLLEVLNMLKMKIAVLEQDRTEQAKRNEELSKHEHFEVRTEPSPRMSSPRLLGTNSSLESSIFIKKQLQMEKSRVIEKKHEIHLHKEQIAYLKKNVRDLQIELERVSELDLSHVKQIWLSLGKEIPILNATAESLIEVFMKMLGFSQNDIASCSVERKGKKSKSKFGIFG